ncbi:MAG: ParB/RepB/Spo0J family partition protein [Clostridia bacterium]|nr:ParB/RepB/Spo0J family partition protein [Clostridia bacterium]
MTENHTNVITRKNEIGNVEGMLDVLKEIEENMAAGETVPPDKDAFESVIEHRPIPKKLEEWRPDVRSLSRKEINRRKAQDKLSLDGAQVINIDISAILPNRSQPREFFESNSTIRLADSIRRYGILQPLTVRLVTYEVAKILGSDAYDEDLEPIEALPSKFEIVAGERRFRAAKMLGMKSVPCIIISADDKKSAELALIENLLREDLNIFETARAMKKLIETFKLTQEEVAKRLSMSQSAVANKLRLLRFTKEEEKAILENHLTERHARALLKLFSPADRLSAIRVITKAHMNVHSTENYIEKLVAAAEAELCEATKTSRKIPIIKDIRLFYNSLDRALDIVKSAGVEIFSKKHEDDTGVTIEIKIPHPRKAV